jgi:hypothetical protein
MCRQRRFVSHELANAKRRFTGLIDLSFPEFARHFDSKQSKAAHAVLKAAPSILRDSGAVALSRRHQLAGQPLGDFLGHFQGKEKG